MAENPKIAFDFDGKFSPAAAAKITQQITKMFLDAMDAAGRDLQRIGRFNYSRNQVQNGDIWQPGPRARATAVDPLTQQYLASRGAGPARGQRTASPLGARPRAANAPSGRPASSFHDDSQ